MTLTTRIVLALVLWILASAGITFGQETTTTPAEKTTATQKATAPESAAPAEEAAATATSEGTSSSEATSTVWGEQSASQLRSEFTTLIQRHPYELGQALALEPVLMTNESYLAGYPGVPEFLKKHPEIIRNPRYYLSEFRTAPVRQSSAFDDFMEGLSIFAVFAGVAIALAWLIRTVIEQRRWTRLSRAQNEVHNKILDRFGSSEELLAYIKTPAGTKFLESAPIPLHAERPVANSPFSRILLSIQVGVVVVAIGLGLFVVSARFDGESSHGFFAMGAIALFAGGGFIASALISLFLSKRLSNWQAENAGSISD